MRPLWGPCEAPVRPLWGQSQICEASLKGCNCKAGNTLGGWPHRKKKYILVQGGLKHFWGCEAILLGGVCCRHFWGVFGRRTFCCGGEFSGYLVLGRCEDICRAPGSFWEGEKAATWNYLRLPLFLSPPAPALLLLFAHRRALKLLKGSKVSAEDWEQTFLKVSFWPPKTFRGRTVCVYTFAFAGKQRTLRALAKADVCFRWVHNFLVYLTPSLDLCVCVLMCFHTRVCICLCLCVFAFVFLCVEH